MKNLIITICVTLLLSSCSVLQKDRDKESELNYMQNIERLAEETSVRSAVSTIQPGDELIIVVMAKDLDVVKPFNQNWSSGETLVNAQPGGNTSSTIVSEGGPKYIVDVDGRIDFPIIGVFDTSGSTLIDLKNELQNRISRYIIEPTVYVKLANYKVTVLGEVNRPGEYTVPDGKATLLSALGMAGDLTMYGKRDDVLLVRNVDGIITKTRIDLTDASFIDSPFYQMKQGDVVYVSANETKEKTAKLDPNTGTYISIASVALGLAGIFITLFTK